MIKTNKLSLVWIFYVDRYETVYFYGMILREASCISIDDVMLVAVRGKFLYVVIFWNFVSTLGTTKNGQNRTDS